MMAGPGHDVVAGKSPAVHRLYNFYVGVERRFGPMTVYAQKTRIVFQARARFAGAVVCKNWIQGGLWLKRRADHPLFHRVEKVPPNNYLYTFRITRPQDLDDDLIAFLRETYAVGRQEYP